MSRSKRPRECSAIRYWKLASLYLLIVVVGCGEPQQAARPVSQPVQVTPVPVPIFGEKTSVGLERDDQMLYVGDPVERAFKVFPAPEKAYDFFEMPKVFGKDFQARGWETKDEAFGVISYGGKVVVALHTVENGTLALATQIRENLEKEVGGAATPLGGGRVNYWFWQSGRHRLMLCTFAEAPDKIHIMEAIGEVAAMDALRMNHQMAREDQATAQKLLEEQERPN